ncbi:MAG: acetyl-CoA carboxylase biotin carboxylase subunit, partial [Porticoccaceae bacterium]
RALNDVAVFGIKTTIPYYLQILDSPVFRSGVFNTGFVDANPQLVNYSNKRRPEEIAAVLAVAIAAHTGN